MNPVEEDTDTSESYSFETSTKTDKTFNVSRDCKNLNFSTLKSYKIGDGGIFSIEVFDPKNHTFSSGTCLTIEQLKSWLKDDQNIMSLYSKPPADRFNEPSGYGTRPLNKFIVRLPNNNIYVTIKSIYRILNKRKFPVKLYAIPLFEGKRRRVGNTKGEFGISQNHGQIDGSIIYKLYSGKEVDVLKFVKEDEDEFVHNKPFIEYFARALNLEEILRYVRNHAHPLDQAVEDGQIKVIKLIYYISTTTKKKDFLRLRKYLERYPEKKKCTENAMIHAANIHIVKWLDNKFKIKMSKDAMSEMANNAINKADLEILKWLQREKHFKLDIQNLMHAVKKGDLDLVDFAFHAILRYNEEIYDGIMTNNVISLTTKNDIRKYLINVMFEYAAYKERLDIIKWLYFQNQLNLNSTIRRAIYYDSINIVKFMHENGVKITNVMVQEAISQPMKDYLKSVVVYDPYDSDSYSDSSDSDNDSDMNDYDNNN